MAKLERDTLNKRVYRRLQQMLLDGDIPLGAQLDERKLAEQMGVSRTPLREAIAHLVREGIVEHRPYRGNFVRTFTIRQVNDLYRVRAALESLAMRLAIPKISQEDIVQVAQILADVNESLRREDIGAFSEADRCFHETIVQLTENEPLIDALNRLSAQIQMVRVYANQDPDVVTRTMKERPRILAALEARDADTAAALMEEHIDGVRRSVIAQMQAAEQAASNGHLTNRNK